MSGFPKTIYVRGVGVPVENWEELDQLIQRYGGELVIAAPAPGGDQKGRRKSASTGTLTATDRALLERFIEEGVRGVLTADIGQALGKRGKAIRPALDGWSRRIGLVTEEGATAFEATKRYEGRGFRMVPHYLRAAGQMLGQGVQE